MGSCTVSVLQLPAWGILTRFHGSAPGRTAATILSGAGGTGKAERGESELSGLGGRGREGGNEGGAGRRCTARALGRSHGRLEPLGKEVIFKFLAEHSEAPASLEQLRSCVFYR